MEFNNKVALVTGASRGIGRAIALELAKGGSIVIINYSSDDDGAKKTIKLLEELGATTYAIKGDLRDYKFVEFMIEKIIKKYDKIDILVNNAGISKFGMVVDMTEEDYYEIMDVNFKSVFNTCKATLKHMMYSGGGVILNISSIWGNTGASCEALYSASKGAMDSFTKSLAKEMVSCNIRVNAIAPGVIETNMNEMFSQDEKEELKKSIGLKRFGKVREIGKAAAFLCSDAASYITGEILKIDGGFL